jgi:cell division protein FtsB
VVPLAGQQICDFHVAVFNLDVFFDANNYFFHKELSDDIKALEESKTFYKKEIEKDKIFIKKMKDSLEMERYAREKYYLKKENEDIYIIEHQDSVK